MHRKSPLGEWLAAMIAASIGCLTGAAHADAYYVSLSGNDRASGTVATPWRTIQHGVDALNPGDTLFIGAGTYRERIEIRRGGTARAPITLAAIPGARVIVSGADRLRAGWSKATGAEDGSYVHEWGYRFPIGGPNDLTHPGDREHQLTGRAEQVIHGGRLLRQVLTRQQLAPGTFYVDLDAKQLYVWLRGSDDPNQTEMEASTRGEWLIAASVSYVHVRGLTFRYAANHAQRGAFAIARQNAASGAPHGWMVEDCVFERANGSGASLAGEGHLFRRCVFQDNGQLGFGTSHCHHTRMEQCGIYRNNAKGYSTGWEAGGCKVTMSRGFVFAGCRSVDNRGTGLWFDIGNEQSEVDHCYIADNDEAGIFYEISYGLHAHDNLIVDNANNGETVGGSWGSGGITLSSSEGCVIEHNTLVGNRDGIDLREQGRTTPRIGAADGAQEVRILNRDHRISDNIVAYSQAYNIGFWIDTTFFGPHPSGGDRNSPVSEDLKTLNIRLANNLLRPLPNRVNYLYGVPWRPRSRECKTPEDFTSASGISDSSRTADPRFADLLAGDYHLLPDSPAFAMRAGIRGTASLPRH
jgi:parallel beta-helix repeat protein